MFWKMCKGYTSNPSTELANAIYSQFIKESAVCQVGDIEFGAYFKVLLTKFKLCLCL